MKWNKIPHQSRINAPGALHHISGREIERKKIFKDDVDRDISLIVLKQEAYSVIWLQENSMF